MYLSNEETSLLTDAVKYFEVGKNYNLPKNEDSRQPQCPEDK